MSNIFKLKKIRPLLALSLAVLLLSGCSSSVPIKETSGATLPPPQVPWSAPAGDAVEGMAQTVLLSLPNAQSGRLEDVSERVLISPGRHPGEFALRRLFTYTATTRTRPLSSQGELSLNPGSAIEISGGTATVNLAPGALSLSNQDRYLASRAIANTLTQWGDIRYVNILVNHRQPGLDTAASLPQGSLPPMENGDILGMWEAASRPAGNQGSPFTAFATLYLPVSAGRGIIAEARPITANSASLPDLALALMEGLSLPPVNTPNAMRAPDLATLLARPPEVEETAGSSGRVIKLAFHETMNEALIAAGIPRSVMMASLTYTLTTFLPYTAGIKVDIGQEAITALVPAGIFEGAGEQMVFENGLMTRQQFSRFLLDTCTLYFATPQGTLRASQRPVPYYQVYNPRFVLTQLMAGPLDTDSVMGLLPVLPQGLTDADLLGITRQNGTILLNLGSRLQSQAAGFTSQQELLMVYGMVNTLTARQGGKDVCFFVNGAQEGTFSGQIDIAGIFLRNEGILE